MSPRAAWRLESLGFKDVYDYAAGKVDWMACGLPIEGREEKTRFVSDILTLEVPTCALNDKLSEIETGSVDSRPWVVINKAKVVLGLVDQAIWSRHKAARAEEIMDPAPVTYRPNTTIEQAAAFMSKHSLSSVLVTTSDGELLGTVDRPIVEHAVDETGPQM